MKKEPQTKCVKWSWTGKMDMLMPMAVGMMGLCLALSCPVRGEEEMGNEVKREQRAEIKEDVTIVLPEDYKVNGRQAHIIRHPSENRYFVTFVATEAVTDFEQSIVTEPNAAEPFSRPIEILPGKWLTNMLLFMDEKPGLSATFRVWGEMTVYQGRNYFLPTFAAALTIFGDVSDNKDDPAKNAAPPTPSPMTMTTPTNDNKTGEADSKTPAKNQLSGVEERLRELLMTIPRPQPLASVTDDPQQLEGGEVETQIITRTMAEGTWRDGEMIVDREGRIYYDTDQQEWLFAFRANSTSEAEPPIVLLPCKLLEVMEKATIGTGQRVSFRITGQATKYNRRNYLLLRYVRVLYDRGNLGY